MLVYSHAKFEGRAHLARLTKTTLVRDARCQHPDNVWSLHGFHECLMRLGKHAEARIIKQRLDIAAAWADVPIKSSCFCRMQTAA